MTLDDLERFSQEEWSSMSVFSSLIEMFLEKTTCQREVVLSIKCRGANN